MFPYSLFSFNLIMQLAPSLRPLPLVCTMVKGADGVVYGGAKGTAKEIKCERVWQLGSAAVLGDLFDGRSDVTEPYYVIDSFYTGTGEACTTDADCRPSHTATGRESCTKNKCAHAKAPRTVSFHGYLSTCMRLDEGAGVRT